MRGPDSLDGLTTFGDSTVLGGRWLNHGLAGRGTCGGYAVDAAEDWVSSVGGNSGLGVPQLRQGTMSSPIFKSTQGEVYRKRIIVRDLALDCPDVRHAVVCLLLLVFDPVRNGCTV